MLGLAGLGISFLTKLVMDNGEDLVKEGIKHITDGKVDLTKTKPEDLTPEQIQMIRDSEYRLAELDFKQMQLQVSVNVEEAKHPSLFIAGWRPMVGWVGAISLAFMYIPKALVMTGFWVYQSYKTLNPEYISNLVDGVTYKTLVDIPQLPVFPDLGTGDIIGLLVSILGVGAMRSYDKKNKTDTRGTK